jgi:hypothetical protein
MSIGTLSHRLYEIWLEEGTDIYDDPAEPTLCATARARRAARLFDERTGQSILSYHVSVCLLSIPKELGR